MSFQFKKRFGQNFLRNQYIINKIVASVPSKYDTVYEIGPGDGALTQRLLNQGKKVIAIEIDSDCVKILQQKFGSEPNIEKKNFEVVNLDVLTYTFPKNACVIGNLPYNISVKILEKFVYNRIECGIFMLQKEVANRVSGADYGRLSIFIRAMYDVAKVVNVEPNDFFPRPKVQSQVIKIIANQKMAVDLEKLTNMTKIIFSARRKKLSWLVKSHPNIAAQLEQFVDLDIRAENIPEDVFWKMCAI